MNIKEFKKICLSFGGAEEDFPFDDNTLAFKVMGEIFALTDADTFESISLKCDPVKAAMLRDLYPEVEPSDHMDKKRWNTIDPQGMLDDEIIKEWIKDSYDLVVEDLSRSDQKKLKKLE